MITLQEQFEKDFPDKSVELIVAGRKYQKSNFTNRDLDLRKYVNLEEIKLARNQISNINLSQNKNLTHLQLTANNLTSVEFLNTIPNPERLEVLLLVEINTRPTDIEIFSRFINLKRLQIGMNRFYGSFKSWKNLTKLEKICIEDTDVNEGLEYLPSSISSAQKGGEKNLSERSEVRAFRISSAQKGGEKNYFSIECKSYRSNDKCQAIQNQLRPFNYDLEAWQLAHPEKMLISRPEYFTNPDSKDKWIEALNKKLSESHQLLIQAKEQETDKLSKIARLEAKIQELELSKSTISRQTQTEFSTQNKSTQTNLSHQDITKLEQQNQQLLKLLQATEQELTSTKQQLKEIQEQLTTSQTAKQEQIKQLESKLKLLEQQKTTYQTKYDNSIAFIREIREDIAKS